MADTTAAVVVRGYRETVEALRSPQLVSWLSDLNLPLRQGTLLWTDDGVHTRRRRLLNRLLRGGALQRFQQDVIAGAIRRHLGRELGERDTDGFARADLVALGRRVFLHASARLAGLDVESEADLAELIRLHAAFNEYSGILTWVGEAAQPVIERGKAAKTEFNERFFQPALAARRHAADVETAPDLLTLIAAHADPGWDEDAEVGLREVVIDGLLGGTDSPLRAMVWTVDHLAGWFAAHPADSGLRTDPGFLLGAASEGIRLHPPTVLYRQARGSLTLSAGTRIAAGQLVALRPGDANRDQAVFGADAASFDPRRRHPAGVPAYGVGFGAGPHMCYGLPATLGSGGTDGSLVALLAALYRAGLEPDPDRPPQPAATLGRDVQNWNTRFASYPVRFP